MLQAERTQFGTQDSVASGKAAVSSDHVRLFQALGGGWRDDTGGAAGSRAGTPATTGLASATPAAATASTSASPTAAMPTSPP